VSVYLVGAGPGDVDLLTLRAARILATADVVVHDRLVGDSVWDVVAPGALRVDVGKVPGASHRQEDINHLLAELDAHYDVVVRLKGGDPFVFGRGGEEALALSRLGIEVHVVAGVSSAFAAPLLAGIPVTHRGLARGVSVVTATTDDGTDFDFESLAQTSLTLVVLMGVARRGAIAEQLQRGGMSGTTPVAVVERAASASQRVVRARLEDLASLDVVAPAVIVIGAVAALELGLGELRSALVGAS